MKNLLFLLLFSICYLQSYAQKDNKITSNDLLKELAEGSCKCIDSIPTFNKQKIEVTSAISKCINKKTGPYQIASKLLEVNNNTNASSEGAKDKKNVDISINLNENSNDYKKYYYEIERYLMANCVALKNKIASVESQSSKSFTENNEAYEFYSKGLDEVKKENYEIAAAYFEKAVKEDPNFAFAWDNLGVNYRRLNQFDKAIEAYKKSLKIDPNGLMPLQNIAVVYQYKKEYQNAIKAYERLAQIDKNNPEIYYGIGHVYTMNLNDYEKGLANMCIAYNMYIEQKSPYRSDAEKVINIIYTEMKKVGKEARFTEILKEHHITQN
jgi:tetratricopeptide (TPR) repeat protein